MQTIAQLFLMTTDLAAARTFYEDALGLTPKEVGETSRSYETGACELKLQRDFEPDVLAEFDLSTPPAEGRGAGAVHVLVVDEPLETVYERMADTLDDSPGRPLIEPRDVPWGDRILLCEDPDGYVWEVRSSVG